MRNIQIIFLMNDKPLASVIEAEERFETNLVPRPELDAAWSNRHQGLSGLEKTEPLMIRGVPEKCLEGVKCKVYLILY